MIQSLADANAKGRGVGSTALNASLMLAKMALPSTRRHARATAVQNTLKRDTAILVDPAL